MKACGGAWEPGVPAPFHLSALRISGEWGSQTSPTQTGGLDGIRNLSPGQLPSYALTIQALVVLRQSERSLQPSTDLTGQAYWQTGNQTRRPVVRHGAAKRPPAKYQTAACPAVQTRSGQRLQLPLKLFAADCLGWPARVRPTARLNSAPSHVDRGGENWSRIALSGPSGRAAAVAERRHRQGREEGGGNRGGSAEASQAPLERLGAASRCTRGGTDPPARLGGSARFSGASTIQIRCRPTGFRPPGCRERPGTQGRTRIRSAQRQCRAAPPQFEL